MLVLQGGRLLKEGENIFDIDTFFLHLLAMCAQKCMKRKGGRGGHGGGMR